MMRRGFFIFVAFLAVVWFQFAVYPGHSYLHGASQAYVPMLERLQTPGFLSRDLVATNPTLTFTVYDEATLFLQEALRIDLRLALLVQALFLRACYVCGVLLLLRCMRVHIAVALVAAALISLNAGEPTPDAFAFALVVLATGLFASEKPLLAGLSGGLALLYDPAIAGLFWVLMLIVFVADSAVRRMVRPMLLIGAIFALLLANLAQLQPGASDTGSLWDQLPAVFVRISQFRTPEIWASHWSFLQWLLPLLACGIAALRLRFSRNRPLPWVSAGMAALGMCAIFLSLVLLDGMHWTVMQHLQWTRFASFVLLFGLLAALALASQLWRDSRRYAAVGALALVCVCAIALHPRRVGVSSGSVDTLADWAARETWGGSMFLFPDAGRGLEPGIFRAEARRAVWVDWTTGIEVNAHQAFADEWGRRWHDTMQGAYSEPRLQRMLSLPVDYVVLHRNNRLQGVKPVYEAGDLLAYDSADLRSFFKLSD